MIFVSHRPLSSWQINPHSLRNGCLDQKGGVDQANLILHPRPPPYLLPAISHAPPPPRFTVKPEKHRASILAVWMLFIAGDQEPFHTG